MKKTFALLSLALLFVIALPAATCAEARQEALTVLKAADAACVLSHAFLPDVPAIEQACKLDQSLAPAIEQYLAEGVRQGLVAPKQGTAAAKWAPDAHAHAPHTSDVWKGRLYHLHPKLG